MTVGTINRFSPVVFFLGDILWQERSQRWEFYASAQ